MSQKSAGNIYLKIFALDFYRANYLLFAFLGLVILLVSEKSPVLFRPELYLEIHSSPLYSAIFYLISAAYFFKIVLFNNAVIGSPRTLLFSSTVTNQGKTILNIIETTLFQMIPILFLNAMSIKSVVSTNPLAFLLNIFSPLLFLSLLSFHLYTGLYKLRNRFHIQISYRFPSAIFKTFYEQNFISIVITKAIGVALIFGFYKLFQSDQKLVMMGVLLISILAIPLRLGLHKIRVSPHFTIFQNLPQSKVALTFGGLAQDLLLLLPELIAILLLHRNIYFVTLAYSLYVSVSLFTKIFVQLPIVNRSNYLGFSGTIHLFYLIILLYQPNWLWLLLIATVLYAVFAKRWFCDSEKNGWVLEE